MFSRKLLDICKSRMIRFDPWISASASTRQFNLVQKSHLRAKSCCPYHASAGLRNEIFFQVYRTSSENHHNQQSNHERNFHRRVAMLISAFIIFLLGIREAFCDPPVSRDTPVPNDSTTMPRSKCTKDSCEVKKSDSSAKPNPNHTEKVPKGGKVLPDLPSKKNHSQDAVEKELPSLPSTKVKEPLLDNSVLSLKTAIDKSRASLNCKLSESGAPGIAISVSVNGEVVWLEGVGLSDVENGLRMSPFSVMRVASISKSLTMVAVCQLIEEGKLDLDVPIQKYVPYFPKKYVDGEEVTITTRQLLNHTSGIRHYELKTERERQKRKKKRKEEDEKKMEEDEGEEEDEKEVKVPKKGASINEEGEQGEIAELNKKRKKTAKLLSRLATVPKEEKDDDSEFKLEEYYIKEMFKSTEESIKLFQDDELLFKPGEEFCYTTHGFTLVSAVIEGASGKKFPDLMMKLFRDMALTRTTLDRDDPIIIRRARMYTRDKRGRLKNAPYVNNSYKWAGGGFLSNVVDLNNFGNVMLYSYQNTQDKEPKGFLKPSTLREIWKASPNTQMNWDPDGAYGLGWGVVEEEKYPKAFAYRRRFYASHTGGAIGASSVLLIMPTSEQRARKDNDDENSKKALALPQGVVVAIITNLQEVGLNGIALQIAKVFERVQQDDTDVLGTIGGNAKHKVYSLDSS